MCGGCLYFELIIMYIENEIILFAELLRWLVKIFLMFGFKFVCIWYFYVLD